MGYMFGQREKGDEPQKLCTKGLIKGPDALPGVIVNPSKNSSEIYFNTTEFVSYCKNHCSQLDNCTDNKRKELIEIFGTSPAERNS